MCCAAILRTLGRLEAALVSYERAIGIDPEMAEAHGNRGTTLLLLNRVAAISSFDRAIELDPGYAEAYFNRAHSRHKLREYEAAAADYKKVAAVAPDFEFLPGAHLESSLMVCHWTDFDALVGQVGTGIENGGNVCEPFVFMGLSDSARLQHKPRASGWDRPAGQLCIGTHSAPRALSNVTVGYFSCDFHARRSAVWWPS